MKDILMIVYTNLKSGAETSSSRGGRGGRKKALAPMAMADSTLVERAMADSTLVERAKADSTTRALADSTTVSPPPPPQGRPHFIKTKQFALPQNHTQGPHTLAQFSRPCFHGSPFSLISPFLRFYS